MIKKGIILTFVLLLVLSCTTSKQENEVSFYVGTYTDSLSKGIYINTVLALQVNSLK
ncbi:hypothetical protein [uncultured Polaribacter sp.]|uniref:hypothetical protein n=1 Tax=uncultured Polaribacter sp. TaxID=174711 RepID=UPI002631DF2B|nr:hypothetical protein [uncultured Polaribacter sp.]